MMNYELFKEVVAEKFMSYMAPEFRDYNLDVHAVTKVNQTLDALNIISIGNSDWKVSPTLYINQMYEHYQDCGDLKEVFQKAAESMMQGFKHAPDQKLVVDFENARNNIVMVLVNTEQNKELLDHAPNRQFQDLSIIYRLVVNQSQDGISSTIINDSLAERIEMTEEVLYQTAVENTKQIFPPTIKSMNEVIRDMFAKDGMTDDMADMMFGDMPEDQTMFVISNDKGINGAASMLYENELHRLSERLGTDLYIMPSSIHEVIAVSTKMGDPNSLAQMVNEINMDQVSLEERLSNQVYHYDMDSRKLSMATDTPHKRLDSIVADTQFSYSSKDQSR
jgi:hypothetical protein